MKNVVCWFDIPADDINSVVEFYKNVFGFNAEIIECETETMACLSHPEFEVKGSIFTNKQFKPGNCGPIISFNVGIDVNELIKRAEANGAKTLRPKTKIEVEGMGYFGVIVDNQGNNIGLYSDM